MLKRNYCGEVLSNMYQAIFTKLFITIKMERDGSLSRHKSSAIRGGMGQVLLQQYCIQEEPFCSNCALEGKCIVRNILYAKYKKSLIL